MFNIFVVGLQFSAATEKYGQSHCPHQLVYGIEVHSSVGCQGSPFIYLFWDGNLCFVGIMVWVLCSIRTFAC